MLNSLFLVNFFAKFLFFNSLFKKESFLFSPRCNINILRLVNKNWSCDQQGRVIVQVNIEDLRGLRFLHVDVSVRCCILQHVEITHKQG
jgi:hypothetical protein